MIRIVCGARQEESPEPRLVRRPRGTQRARRVITRRKRRLGRAQRSRSKTFSFSAPAEHFIPPRARSPRSPRCAGRAFNSRNRYAASRHNVIIITEKNSETVPENNTSGNIITRPDKGKRTPWIFPLLSRIVVFYVPLSTCSI